MLRRTTATCNASNSASNRGTRSTCRGAIARRRVGWRRRNRFKHSTSRTSSPSWVLPATQSGASSGIPDALKSCRNSGTRDATFAVWSNFTLPVRCNRSGATPTASQRARSSSSGMPTHSKSRKNGATHRLDFAKRPADLGERRAFASITGIPRASQSAIKFGQISPSTNTSPIGRIKSSVRRTTRWLSTGLYIGNNSSAASAKARAYPVEVVTERTTEISGTATFKVRASFKATSVSPTLIERIQSHRRLLSRSQSPGSNLPRRWPNPD